MENILYEAKESYGIDPYFIVLCIICGFIIFIAATELKELKPKESIFGFCFLIFLIAMMLFIVGSVVYTMIDGRDKVYDEYEKGNYLTVEGEIVNYDTSVDIAGETQYDSFEVSGLVFFAPGGTTQWGYPFTQSDGSPLKNGIKVKIRYVPYKYENVIMYLELLESKTGDGSMS